MPARAAAAGSRLIRIEKTDGLDRAQRDQLAGVRHHGAQQPDQHAEQQDPGVEEVAAALAEATA